MTSTDAEQPLSSEKFVVLSVKSVFFWLLALLPILAGSLNRAKGVVGVGY